MDDRTLVLFDRGDEVTVPETPPRSGPCTTRTWIEFTGSRTG